MLVGGLFIVAFIIGRNSLGLMGTQQALKETPTVETGNEATESKEVREQEQASAKGTKENSEPSGMKINSRYLDYSPEAFAPAAGKKRVYFFHAAWCSSCRAADAEFRSNLDKIPQDVVLFETDYDTQTALKKQYDITYQHTFVYVDAAGKEIKKWNGGGVAELVEKTKSN